MSLKCVTIHTDLVMMTNCYRSPLCEDFGLALQVQALIRVQSCFSQSSDGSKCQICTNKAGSERNGSKVTPDSPCNACLSHISFKQLALENVVVDQHH